MYLKEWQPYEFHQEATVKVGKAILYFPVHYVDFVHSVSCLFLLVLCVLLISSVCFSLSLKCTSV